LVSIGLVSLTASAFGQAVVSPGVEAYALNTIAGYSTVVRTSQTVPNAKVIFELRKPTGETVKIDATTSAKGVAITDISDYHLKVSGQYQIAAHLESATANSWNNFVVFPGKLSQSASKIYPENQVSSPNVKAKPITVRLKDNFGNPIEDHQVRLIASAPYGEIKALDTDSLTNENGEVSFSVTYPTQATVTYSAYDVTEDLVLDTNAKVAYFAAGSSEVLFQSTLPSVNYAAGNSSGQVDHFKFEDFPDEINPGQSASLTLTAYDLNDQVVPTYAGTVRFSVLGSNSAYVSLPEDYTFELSDQGKHTFSLAFNFQRVGQYDLKATDVDNIAVFGEETIDVIESDSLSANVPAPTGIRITNPIAGTYSSNLQVISGKAEPGAGLKIFDNEVEIAQLIADIEGNFSFTTGLLVDGVHMIHVAQVDSQGGIVDVSDTVRFSVDTSAPELGEVTFDPAADIVPGSAVKVKLMLDEAISQAAMILNGNMYDLEDAGDGSYVGAFAAPMDFGEYSVDFVVTDELGNESKYEKYTTLKVGSFPVAMKSYPANVQNLQAVPHDSRVSLEWSKVPDSGSSVVRYRVYYGVSPNELVDAVDTFTTASNWYVPNLVNGTTYYFAVVAVDSMGKTSEGFSNIVGAMPNPTVMEMPSVDIFEGSAGSDALNAMEADVTNVGPEANWLVALSALAGYFYTIVRRRLMPR